MDVMSGDNKLMRHNWRNKMRNIQVIKTIKLHKAGSPIAGYVISIPGFEINPVIVSCDVMKNLIKHKYIKGTILSDGRIVNVDVEDKNAIVVDSISIESHYGYILNTLNRLMINKVKSKQGEQKSKPVKSSLKAKQAETELNLNISRLQRNDKIKLMGVITSVGNRGRQKIIGYTLAYKGKRYDIGKDIGTRLGEMDRIEDAVTKNNSQSGKYLEYMNGNRELPRIRKQVADLILDMPDELEKAPVVRNKVLGMPVKRCIFNQVGKIVGLTVIYGGEERSIKISDIDYVESTYGKIKLTRGLTAELDNKYERAYNKHTSKLYGADFITSVNIVSPHMTIEMSKDLFGEDGTVMVNDVVNYGDMGIHNKLIQDARWVEEEILKTGTLIEIDIRKVSIVCRANIASIKDEVGKFGGTRYIITDGKRYYCVDYESIHSLIKDKEVKTLTTVWVGEIKYSNYKDGQSIKFSIKRIRDSVRESIINGD